jgi:hypothetical protein
MKMTASTKTKNIPIRDPIEFSKSIVILYLWVLNPPQHLTHITPP